MRKFIYNSIVAKLQTITDQNEQPVIKHFDIWNNNIEYIDEEQPFNTPAVFVEFQPIEWRHMGGGMREAAVNIVLHVITQHNMPTASGLLPYSAEAFDFFELLTAINACLHAHAKQSPAFIHDSLTAVRSTTDHDCAELRHDTETFCCHVTDMSAKKQPQTITVTPEIKIGND